MYLLELKLENVRAIRSMTVDFRKAGAGELARRWTVLLGENGCGKSTVLKAIGLLLAGSEALPDLIGEPDQWIRNSAEDAKIDAIISTAAGETRSISLTIVRGDGRDAVIKRNNSSLAPLDDAIRHSDRNYFIAGYGAFRRPADPTSRSSGTSGYRGRGPRLATLFSSGQELMNLEAWAMDLDYTVGPSGRAIVADALGKLLPGMTFKDIDKSRRMVVMSTVDGDVPLRQLSEGYQAMAAWAGDLLFRMTETFTNNKNPLSARGVMLIDEMDLHLHPVWKRSLVDFLNGAFPNLQIIATTHSPLSIQQCGEGELFVVKRDDLEPVLVPFVGDPSRLRLSELFLSPLIGLDTLDSPKVAILKQEARDIEFQHGAKSSVDLARLRTIEGQLEGTTSLPSDEVPALAQLLAFQARVENPDAIARLREAEALFGTSRPALGASLDTPSKSVVPKK